MAVLAAGKGPAMVVHMGPEVGVLLEFYGAHDLSKLFPFAFDSQPWRETTGAGGGGRLDGLVGATGSFTAELNW